jgi:dienelactone hydrolase
MKKNLFFIFLSIIIVIFLIFYLNFIFKNKIELLKINQKMVSSNNDSIFNKDNSSDNVNKKRIKVFTEDGVEIIGDYYQVADSKFVGILIHMMPADRKSFNELAQLLNNYNYSAIAIDLRGHGESLNSSSGKLDYKKFSDEEHQNYIFDIKAISKFLESQGFPLKNQFLIGASIGANLSLQFLANNKEVKAAVLLSPGVNYRGIKIENFLESELGNKLLVISTKNDFQSYSSLEIFKQKAPSTTIIVYDDNTHGTDIFKNHTELYQKIISFLKERLID